jgi:hypothetical protein
MKNYTKDGGIDKMDNDELLHKLQTEMDKVKQLVEQYPNDKMLGEQIRFYITKIGDTQ